MLLRDHQDGGRPATGEPTHPPRVIIEGADTPDYFSPDFDLDALDPSTLSLKALEELKTRLEQLLASRARYITLNADAISTHQVIVAATIHSAKDVTVNAVQMAARAEITGADGPELQRVRTEIGRTASAIIDEMTALPAGLAETNRTEDEMQFLRKHIGKRIVAEVERITKGMMAPEQRYAMNQRITNAVGLHVLPTSVPQSNAYKAPPLTPGVGASNWFTTSDPEGISAAHTESLAALRDVAVLGQHEQVHERVTRELKYREDAVAAAGTGIGPVGPDGRRQLNLVGAA